MHHSEMECSGTFGQRHNDPAVRPMEAVHLGSFAAGTGAGRAEVDAAVQLLAAKTALVMAVSYTHLTLPTKRIV